MARSAQSRTKAAAPAGRRPTKEASAKPAGEPKGRGAVRTPKTRTTAAPQRPAAGAKRPAGSAKRPAAPAKRPASSKTLVAKKPAAKSSAPKTTSPSKTTSAPKSGSASKTPPRAPKREPVGANRPAKAPAAKALTSAQRPTKAPASVAAKRPASAPAKAAKAKRTDAAPAPKKAVSKRPSEPVLVAAAPKRRVPVAKTPAKKPIKPKKSAAKMPAAKRTTTPEPATSLSPFGLMRPLGLASQARQLAAASERLAERRERDLLPHRIETTRLVLRAPIRGDVPALARLADNPRIAANLTRLPSPYTRNDAVAFVEVISQRPDGRPYAISRDGELVGVIGLTFKLGQPPELGYWLGEPYWGKGIMTEAVRGIIEAVREKDTFRSLVAHALADNTASLRVLEKTGFKATEQRTQTEGPHKDREIIVLRLELGR